jgi:3-oxoacyl-[acyl-carrier protein] reductase
LTRNLARKWARKGVRVNAIAPGLIATPMTAPMQSFPDLVDAELAHIPMGRVGTADEVVGATVFLASSAARYITGHTLVVDGGYLVGG